MIYFLPAQIFYFKITKMNERVSKRRSATGQKCPWYNLDRNHPSNTNRERKANSIHEKKNYYVPCIMLKSKIRIITHTIIPYLSL